jgi:WD40 repeat protein
MPVGTAAFVPDGKHLFVTDDDDGWAYLIGVRAGDVKQVLPEHDPPGEFLFAHGGTRCVRYGWSGEKDAPTLEWWRYPSWKLYKTWDIFPAGAEQFAALAFSPDDRSLAGLGSDGVELYDVARGKRLGRFPVRFGGERAILAFHPGGRRLAAGFGKRMTILDVPTMQEVATLKLAKKSFLDGAFTPDGRLLLTASNEDTVKVWDTTTWTQIREYAWGIGAAFCVAVAPHGETAAAAGKGGPIVVWDLD